MPVSEQEMVDLLAGVTRVNLAIIRGLSQNHPRSAENIIRQLQEEASLAGPDGVLTLSNLPAKYLLGLLEVKPPNAAVAPAKRPRRRLFAFWREWRRGEAGVTE